MKAMIFSAGLGTRFKPWTDKHPKALAIVNGKSLLQRNIEYLQSFEIKDIVVNVHHFPNQIEKAIEKNNGWGSNIIISDERNEVLETGGGLLKAKDLFTPGEKFITCNVDILTNLDISKLINFHSANKALISFAVTNRKTSRYLLFDENNRLCGWRNTKTGEEKGPHLTSPEGRGTTSLIEKAYSCVVVFEYDIFRLMEENNFSGKFSLIDVYLKLAADHRIMGYDHSGDSLVDVGKPESVAIAESVFI
ncbi:MAG: NTP transferase domain-containing protein [Chitinophagaceae bacterium]|nr:NTP transferase domain-containing protein [Chitinophagaceae bacterium]